MLLFLQQDYRYIQQHHQRHYEQHHFHNSYEGDEPDQIQIFSYFFEADNFLIKKEEITQKTQERMLQIVYPNHSDYNKMSLPTGLIIDAIQKGEKTNINIDYNTVTFNEELSFPYSVPEGYERIFIN